MTSANSHPHRLQSSPLSGSSGIRGMTSLGAAFEFTAPGKGSGANSIAGPDGDPQCTRNSRVDRLFRKQQVVGSNPTVCSIFFRGGSSSLVRAPVSHTGESRFDSVPPHQFLTGRTSELRETSRTGLDTALASCWERLI